MSYPNPPYGQPNDPNQPGNQPAQPWPQPGQQPPAGYPPPAPQPGYPQYPQTGYPQQPGYPPQQPGYPQPMGNPPYPPPGAYPPPYGGAPMLQPIQPKKNMAGRIVGIIAGVLVVLVVLCGVGATILSKAHLPNNNTAYTAAVPGPNCDKGAADWQLASGDSALSGTCQSGGYVLTKSGNFDTLGEFFFNGIGSSFTFGKAYRIAITGALQSSDALAHVGIEVHRDHEGGQIFLASGNHEWEVQRNKRDGSVDKRLAIGFTPQAATTFALSVEVESAVMTFTINGQQVAQVTDDTYTQTGEIGIVLGDSDAKSSISAIFSQFAYTPLPDPTLSDSDALATATAAAQTTNAAPYRAAIPGPGCDHGGAQWASAAYLGVQGITTSCQATGLQIAQTADAKSILGAIFYNRDGTFPTNYSVSADIDLSKLHGTANNPGCVGMDARVDPDLGHDAFFICTDGAWEIERVDTSGNRTVLDSGAIAPKTKYGFAATLNGASLKLVIDGQVISTVSDSTLTNTDHISLLVEAPANTAGSALFKNFVFTPLP